MFRRIGHHKTSKNVCIRIFFCRKTTIVSCRRCQMMLAWAETRWGRKKAAAEEESSNDLVTFDTVFQRRNGYSTRNLTKCARFDVNWYRQWPVAGSVGCLSARTKAYQMTLKISSTTITLEGRRRTSHGWRACECARWKERFGAAPYNYPHCAPHGGFKGQERFCGLASRFVALLQEARLTHAHICMYMYISWLESFAQVYLCHWLAGSNVMCLHIHK